MWFMSHFVLWENQKKTVAHEESSLNCTRFQHVHSFFWLAHLWKTGYKSLPRAHVWVTVRNDCSCQGLDSRFIGASWVVFSKSGNACFHNFSAKPATTAGAVVACIYCNIKISIKNLMPCSVFFFGVLLVLAVAILTVSAGWIVDPSLPVLELSAFYPSGCFCHSYFPSLQIWIILILLSCCNKTNNIFQNSIN